MAFTTIFAQQTNPQDCFKVSMAFSGVSRFSLEIALP